MEVLDSASSGHGFLDAVDQKALEREPSARASAPFAREVPLPVRYKERRACGSTAPTGPDLRTQASG